MNRPWLAHYDYWVPPHLSYPSRPLYDMLDATVIDVPNRPATAFLGATLTFRDIKAQSDWFAGALCRLGVGTGDRVGIMLPNCPQYIVAAFGVLRTGAVLVNINPTYTARELHEVAVDSGLRVLVTLDVLTPVVTAAREGTSIEQVIVTSIAEYAAGGAAGAAVAAGAGTAGEDAAALARADAPLRFTDLVRGEGRPPIVRASVDVDDLAVLQYTGGTTGTPKGAMLTHRSLFTNVVQTETVTYRSRVRGEARYLLIIPYYHVFGFTVGMLKGVWVGALQVIIPKYDVEQVLTAIRDFEPTYFPAVPTIFVSLASHPEAARFGLDRVRHYTTGGAPCPLPVLERWEELTGRPLFEGYGLSEASPVTHSTPQFGLRRHGTIGVPLPDTDIKIVDIETGRRELTTGEPGELCIAGPQLMKGYWRRPEETAHVLRRHDDGRTWLHTGDIATIDADGLTTIVQRKKDMIIVDGFNVYPSEVEAVLSRHPGVRQVAAIGLPDAYHGEVVRACVVLHDNARPSADDLIAHCRTSLAPYKVPAQVDVRDSLPMTPVGKVLYRALREELLATGGPTRA